MGLEIFRNLYNRENDDFDPDEHQNWLDRLGIEDTPSPAPAAVLPVAFEVPIVDTNRYRRNPSVPGPQRIRIYREVRVEMTESSDIYNTDAIGNYVSVEVYETPDGKKFESYGDALSHVREYDLMPISTDDEERTEANRIFMEVFDNINFMMHSNHREPMKVIESYLEDIKRRNVIDRFAISLQPDTYSYRLYMAIGEYSVWYDISRDILSHI